MSRKLFSHLGYLCNLSWHPLPWHKRTELIDKATAELIPEFIRRENVRTLDLTGGTPEMNPYFKYLVIQELFCGGQTLAT